MTHSCQPTIDNTKKSPFLWLNFKIYSHGKALFYRKKSINVGENENRFNEEKGINRWDDGVFSIAIFFSPIGSFILSLLPFVLVWGLYNYFFGFGIWVSFSFLIYHIFCFELSLRKKYEEEMLTDYFVIKEAFFNP